MSYRPPPPLWRRHLGCNLTLVAIPAAIAVLYLLAARGCAAQEASAGFPQGLSYVRVLEQRSDLGFREGCTFIAYRLDGASSLKLQRNGGAPPDKVWFHDASARNTFSRYRPTPLPRFGDGYRGYETRDGYLYALGATHCRSGDAKLPAVEVLLQEPGNFYSISSNREGFSLISPGRRLVLFLYFG